MRKALRYGIFVGFPPGVLTLVNGRAAYVTDVSAGLRQMWEGRFRNGRGVFTNSWAVALRVGIS